MDTTHDRDRPEPVRQNRSLVIFLVVTFAWTWSIELIGRSRLSGPPKLEDIGVLILAASFGPTVGAIVAVISERGMGGLRVLGSRFGPVRGHWRTWVLAGYVLVPSAIVMLLAFSSGHLAQAASQAAGLLLLPLVGFFSIITGPLGEEFGWRGLLLPALLIRMAPWKAAIAVGAIWALWHAPLWTFSDFITDLPAATFVPLYIVSVIAFSLVMTVLHLRAAGSVFLAMFAHAAFNACVLPFEALDDDQLLSAPVAWPFTATIVLTAAAVGIWQRELLVRRAE
jgi:uncharacterized protein